MNQLDKEINIYLEQRRKEQTEAKYRVIMKHALKKAGISHNPNASTKELEILYNQLSTSSD